MKRLSLSIFLSAGIILLFGCQTDNPKNLESRKMVNLLLDTNGHIELKREGWPDYYPIEFGAYIDSTDLLQTDGEAVILCADLNVVVFTGKARCPCPINQGWLIYEGYQFSSQQRGASTEIPYIVYPRNTLILDGHPILQWHDTGANSYNVSVEQIENAQIVWSKESVPGATFQYPADAPRLVPGVEYLLIVQEDIPGGKSSIDDPIKGLGFQLINEEGRREIDKIKDLIFGIESLDELTRQMIYAVYLSGFEADGTRRPWGEVWSLLDNLNQYYDSPAVRLKYADSLTAVKLPVEAEAAYLKAVQSAINLGDIESQAAGQAGLWRVTGDIIYFNNAIDLYESLEDSESVNQLRNERSIP